MSDTKYELSIFEKELNKLTDKANILSKLLQEPMPYERYFAILDEIKKVQGTDEMLSKRIRDLIKEGANLEKNLVKLTKIRRKADDHNRDTLFELNGKISFLSNKVALLKMRIK